MWGLMKVHLISDNLKVGHEDFFMSVVLIISCKELLVGIELRDFDK